jgi:peptide/nickel transport system ATP-binding protein
MESLLEVKNLVTQFKKDDQYTLAVNDVSFTVNRGEIIGIVGESGSGKSVTSLSIMRLIPNPPGKITGGSMLFTKRNGEQADLTALTEREMRSLRGSEIAMIFQEPMTSLNPVMRCGKQVMECIMLHEKVNKQDARKRTIDLFREVQLPDPEGMFSRYPHQLSGGQKQRVMIAMAISCRPQLLIADEPTTALDVTIQKTILELLKRLQLQYGMGIIFITHDLGVIAELAHKVVVMYKGKVVEQGNVADIFVKPAHPYTKSLLACRPPLDHRIRRLPVVSDFMYRETDGTIVERVADNRNGVRITHEERKSAHNELYGRKKILQLQGVNTWFPSKKSMFGKVLEYTRAVDNVTFDVYEGETLGLVGESGCGKTTLGRTILRLAPAKDGKIIYEGTDLLKLGEKENSRNASRNADYFSGPIFIAQSSYYCGECRS